MDDLIPDRPGANAVKDLAGRAGYDPGFLDPPVPIPTLTGVKTVLLHYTHFSVMIRPDKRLAAVTALAMDGKKADGPSPGRDTVAA